MMDERGNPYPDEYKPRDERVGLGRRPAPPPAPAVAEAEMMTIEITVPPNHKEGAKLMCRRTSKLGHLLLGDSARATPILLEPLASCRLLGAATASQRLPCGAPVP